MTVFSNARRSSTPLLGGRRCVNFNTFDVNDLNRGLNRIDFLWALRSSFECKHWTHFNRNSYHLKHLNHIDPSSSFMRRKCHFQFLFCFSICSAKDMVDVFKSHVQDAFSFIRHPGAPLENSASDERFTATASNRAAIEKQRRRLADKENEKQVCDSMKQQGGNWCENDLIDGLFLCYTQVLEQNLYHIKDTPPKLTLPKKTLNALSCRYCSPSQSVSIVKVDFGVRFEFRHTKSIFIWDSIALCHSRWNLFLIAFDIDTMQTERNSRKCHCGICTNPINSKHFESADSFYSAIA